MRGILSSSAATVLIGALFAAGDVGANPTGAPVPESPPLSCQTQAFAVEAVTGSGGEFPKPFQCNSQPCSDYHYRISSATLNVDHTVFAVSATQNLFSTSPTATVSAAGAGDTATAFLAYADHEYAVRFNSSNTKSIEAHIFISGQSKPRIGSVLVRSGTKRTESCLIATPGVAAVVDQFQPIYVAQTVMVAGGQCVADLHYDASGILVDVTTDTSGCFAGQPTGGVLIVNGEELRNNAGPHGITFGNGTTTCYGPPVPSIPKCICTRLPCP
jgi:hypothetical protein